MAKINFGGVVEDVVTREEFPMDKALTVLKNEVIAIIGYGTGAQPSRQWFQCYRWPAQGFKNMGQSC
jgi:hypothetical protein